MPMSTAIDWMKDGYCVRRASWPRNWQLRLHPGYMAEFTEVVNGCVLGIPQEHYIRVRAGTPPYDNIPGIREPLFIMSIDDHETEWKITADSALATDCWWWNYDNITFLVVLLRPHCLSGRGPAGGTATDITAAAVYPDMRYGLLRGTQGGNGGNSLVV